MASPKSYPRYYESSSEYAEMLRSQGQGVFATYVDLFVALTAQHGRVLDVGCGAGTSTFQLRKAGFDAVGSDVGQALPRQDGFLKVDFEDASGLADESFDAVGTMNVLEHVEQPRRFLEEMVRVCRVGGHVIVLSPNLTSPLVAGRIALDLYRDRVPFLGISQYRDAAKLLVHNSYRSARIACGRDAFEPRADTIASGIVGYDVDAIYWTNALEVKRFLRRRNCTIVRYQGAGRTPATRLLAKVAPSLAGQLLVVGRRDR
jgi:SAM-dependent methyltransferase